MAIEFECPTCGGTLQVGDESAGRVIRCGGCLTMLRVPAADPGSPTTGTAAPAAPASPFETAPLPPRQRPASPTPVQPPDKPRRRRRDSHDPYDNRPRRTRQRPAQSGGYGVFFWLVVLGGVMLFFVVACCGGLLLMMPGAKWHTHESKPGGFKVELPAKAQPDIANAAGVRLEKNEHAEGAVLIRQVEHFVIIYRDMPSTKDRAAAPKGRTDEDEMKQAIKELLAATEKVGQAREERITVGGFPACELEYQGKAGWYTARIIVADTRLYIVFAGGVEPLGSTDVRRFLDSFTITEPKLVAEGKEREEKAKQAKEREEKAKQDKEQGGKLPVAPPPRPVDE